MRTIVVDKETNLQSIAKQLSGQVETRAGALEKLAELNPHVDGRRIEPGTILLVPEGAGFVDAESTSLSSQSFGGVRQELIEAVDATAARLLASHDSLLEESKQIAALLRSAAMNRAIEADPDLKALVEDATVVQKADQQQAKDAKRFASALREQVEAEFDTLAKLLD